MLKIFIITVSLFLSVIGLSELLHRLWMLMLSPKKTKNYLVTVLDKTCAAEQVTATLEDVRWNGRSSACILIGIDCGLSEEKAAACKLIEEVSEDFIIATPERLWDEILSRS